MVAAGELEEEEEAAAEMLIRGAGLLESAGCCGSGDEVFEAMFDVSDEVVIGIFEVAGFPTEGVESRGLDFVVETGGGLAAAAGGSGGVMVRRTIAASMMRRWMV